MKLNKKVVDLINEGFKAKTLKSLSDRQLNQLHEKVCKKKEPKEAVTKTSTTTTFNLNDPIDTDKANAALAKNGADADIRNKKINVTNMNGQNPVEMGENKNSKNNPWAICTASVGRKDKKKFEKCVKDVKKKNKGKIEENLFLEQKILNLVQKYIHPKMSKKDFMSAVLENAEPTTKPKEPTTKPGTKTPPKEKPFDPFKPEPHKNPKPKARKRETKEQVLSKKKSIPNWLNFNNLGVKFK